MRRNENDKHDIYKVQCRDVVDGRSVDFYDHSAYPVMWNGAEWHAVCCGGCGTHIYGP